VLKFQSKFADGLRKQEVGDVETLHAANPENLKTKLS
jgi:hypothetical protein